MEKKEIQKRIEDTIQTKLYPNLISKDSHQLGAGEGAMAWITFWNGAFNIELLFLLPESDHECN